MNNKWKLKSITEKQAKAIKIEGDPYSLIRSKAGSILVVKPYYRNHLNVKHVIAERGEFLLWQ